MTFIELLFPLSLFTCIVAVYLSQNPVYGVLAFVAVVLHVVFLLIALDLEFLAYSLAIIYIGAVLVLFLFVIMMFSIYHFKAARTSIRAGVEYFIMGWFVTNIIFYFMIISSCTTTDFMIINYSSSLIELTAWYLFNEGYFLAVLAALMMLIGAIGAILITSPLRVSTNVPVSSKIKISSSLNAVDPFTIRVRKTVSNTIKKNI